MRVQSSSGTRRPPGPPLTPNATCADGVFHVYNHKEMLMNTKQKPAGLVIAAGMKARWLASELQKELASEKQYLEKELDVSAIRLNFQPPVKEIVRQVAQSRHQAMTEYCRAAVLEAVKRDLEADIAEMDAMDGEAA